MDFLKYFRAAVPTRDQRQSAVGRAGGGAEGLAVLSSGLARALADKNAGSNLVFSPLTIYTALALVAAGARGATLQEIFGVLGVRSREELDEFVASTVAALRDRSGYGGPLVAFACGVWSDLSCPLKPGFREAVVDGVYKADASTVDFRGNPSGAVRLINAWAERATNGLIKSVLGPESVRRLTRVILGNGIYFKGKWDKPFEKKNTQNALFRRLGGAGAVDVPFMRSWKPQYIAVHHRFKVLKLRYKMTDEAQPSSVDLRPFLLHHAAAPSRPASSNYYNLSNPAPYAAPLSRNEDLYSLAGPSQTNALENPPSMPPSNVKTQFSMCIFLPDADDGLPKILQAIASRPGFLHEHLPRKKVEVGKFHVPRFQLSFHSSVVGVLNKLGLRLPFHETADLSEMMVDDDSGFPLVLNEIVHKAGIEVNEEGTEAAAINMACVQIGCAVMSRQQPRVDFVADHPFAYFIVEEDTGAVVFARHVLDPSRE